MRLTTDALQLSLGCAPNAAGTFNMNDGFEIEPMSPELVASALARVFGPPTRGVYRWEENGESLLIGPVFTSPDYSDDGEACFMEAELLVDMDLTRFVSMLEAVCKTAPALWLRQYESEDFFSARAFAAELRAVVSIS